MFGRQKVTAYVAEFLGTGVLTLIILSVKLSNLGSLPLFVAAAAGLAYIAMYFTVAEVSGGHFNPALTISAWTVRKISTVNAVFYVAFQLLGAWAAYGLYTYFIGTKLNQNVGHFAGRVFTAEAVGAGIFAFAFASALYQGFNRAVSATVSGLGLLIGTVAASTVSLALLNPAVALGLKSWIWTTYVLAPVVGAVVGFNVYYRLFTQSGYSKLVAAFSTGSAKTAAVKKPVAKKKTATKRKK